MQQLVRHAVVAPRDARALASTLLLRATAAAPPPQFPSAATKSRVSSKRIVINLRNSPIQFIAKENSHAKAHASRFIAHVACRRHSRRLLVRARKNSGRPSRVSEKTNTNGL